MTPLRVGDIVIHPLYDGTVTLKPQMWSGSDWTEHQDLINEHGNVVVPVGGFLVRSGDHLLLADAGVGDVHNDLFDAGAMMDSLAAIGVRPSDIETVLISHLHSDHMGWLETNGAATFASATVHIGAADWDYFVINEGDGPRRARRMKVIEDQVSLLDRDGITILPGITTRATPGHTPGHTSTVISSGTERLIMLGDALHCPAQLTETEWEFIFDVDPSLAKTTRQALVREAEDPNTSLLPCHFPGLQAARLLPATGERRWVLGSS